MGTDDGTSRGDGPDRDDRGAAHGDPVRDLLLGLANQIDALAGLFARGPQDAGATVSGYAAAFGADGPVGHAFAGASGEITSLLSEIGDLIARLLAAVIAVLEAIAEALRSAPTTTSEPRHYEPIAVRIGTPRRPDARTGPDQEQ